jgi:hypothetical protein
LVPRLREIVAVANGAVYRLGISLAKWWQALDQERHHDKFVASKLDLHEYLFALWVGYKIMAYSSTRHAVEAAFWSLSVCLASVASAVHL